MPWTTDISYAGVDAKDPGYPVRPTVRICMNNRLIEEETSVGIVSGQVTYGISLNPLLRSTFRMSYQRNSATAEVSIKVVYLFCGWRINRVQRWDVPTDEQDDQFDVRCIYLGLHSNP